MDWNEIKAEYISTKIGYRELAKKNGLSFSRLQRRATGEKWPELRRQLHGGGTEAAGSGGDRARRVQNVADLLLDKIALTIENMDGSSNRAVSSRKAIFRARRSPFRQNIRKTARITPGVKQRKVQWPQPELVR